MANKFYFAFLMREANDTDRECLIDQWRETYLTRTTLRNCFCGRDLSCKAKGDASNLLSSVEYFEDATVIQEQEILQSC